ncbi:MAG: hypothetical protein GXP17_11345 [Gammaproteobacteria bacterium]|nr:hypothetical protein [Gammaproteobacteria bacterium]
MTWTPSLSRTHRIAALLFLLLLLNACSTAALNAPDRGLNGGHALQEQQFQQGKLLFLNKAYGDAAVIFLPLAQQGHLGAQYTIGYMYYYGYGVSRNERETLRWLSVAAARGYPKAQKALMRINGSSAPTSPPSKP